MIDDRVLQERIKRIAIINDKGTRIDLPVNSRGRYFIWVERVKDGSDIRGEKVCMRNDKILFRVIHYYSDGRFVTDIDIDGGFR